MPPIIMLALERDDIRDCLLWNGVMALVALVLYRSSRKMDEDEADDVKSNSQTVKVTKIE